MNDDHDLESQLRSHLRHRADHVDAPTGLGGSLLVREDARRRTATRHRRRMATASIATAAAVAAGLVVIARDPGTQDVSTNRSQAASDQAGLAGAATGSSTGSSSGSPTGWTNSYEETTDSFSGLSLRVPTQFDLVARGSRTSRQGTGEAAADLAVAADATPGAPLRFIVASVQDARRLQSGKGGTETTILGRHARIISKRAATTITWDITDTERVLVTSAGVDDAVLTDWLSGLTKDASGQWVFAPSGPGGLTAIATVTPTENASGYQTWQYENPEPDGDCAPEGYDLNVSAGGTYDLWGSLADNARWSTSLPAVAAVTLPGATSPAVAFVGEFGEVATLDGELLIRVSQWNRATALSTSTASDLVGLIFTPTAAERQEVVEPTGIEDPDCETIKGAPRATDRSDGEAEPALTTLPPTTEMTTTSIVGDVTPTTGA